MKEVKPPWGDSKLEAAARVMMASIRKMNPDWDQKISVAQQEKGYTDYQCFAAWVGRILDSGEHMLHPPHPFFERGFVAQGEETLCPQCTRDFRATWAGQEYCTDQCFEAAHSVSAVGVLAFAEVEHAGTDAQE